MSECKHDEVTSTYCGNCGKRVGYDRPVDLLRHLESCAAAAKKKAVGKVGSTRGAREAVKWASWAKWVKDRIEGQGSQSIPSS